MSTLPDMLPFPDLLAVDLDGTILRSDSTLSKRTTEALRELENRGCIPVISTGRNYRGVLPFIEQLGLDSPAITSNGAMIISGPSGEILYERLLPDHISRSILIEARKRGIYFQGFSHDHIYYETRGEESQFYEGITGLEGKLVNFDEWAELKFVKALMIGRPSKPSALWPELLEVQKTMKTRYGNTLYAVFSRPFYLDFMAGEVSKGAALKWLSRKYGIAPERVAAFGDALNDRDMLQYAGISVAMKNAPKELQDACSYVTTYTNEQDGAAEFIEKIFLR